MTLVELGVVLRAEREKRGLDIEDAANKLKISARLLRALEEGEEQFLPPLAYTKGFIRSYAAYVGLSAEEVGDALAELEAAAEVVTPQNVYEPELMLAPRRNLKPIMTLIVAVIIVGGIIVAWQQGVFDFLGRQSRRLAQPAPMQSAESVDPGNLANRPPVTPPAASSSAAAPKPAQGRTPQAEGQTAALGAAQPGVAAGAQHAQSPSTPAAQPGAPGLPPVRLPGTDAAAPAQASPATASSAPSASAEGGERQTAPHKVIITAIDECWVHSSADKTDTRQFSLHKGDTFALTFNKSLELKLGNAGGVRLRYNGEDLPPVGQNGQVRTLVFPPAERP